MRHHLTTAFACVCLASMFVLGPVRPARAAQPRVVRTVPVDGDTSVDPTLNEVRVEFDQDMDRGSVAWVGGGETFPNMRGVPRWVSKRECVLAVTLEPNHDYWLSVNSTDYTGFRNLAGEPAVPHPLSFKTTDAGKTETVRLTPELNRRAIDELRRSIDEDYSYRDLHDLDWDKLFAEHAPKLEAATTPEEFAVEAARLLANARDIHIWLMVGNQIFGTHQRDTVPNYDRNNLARLVPGWKRWNECVASGRFEDGIGYILIESWERKYADQIQAVFAALDELADTSGLIIDIRPNSGGDEMLARGVAGCFVTKPCPYAKSRNRAIDLPGGFTPPYERVLVPTEGRPTYHGKVAVLMGPRNMSSAEAFLLMMKQVPGCKLVGAATYGAAGNPQGTGLPNNVTVYLPSWQGLMLDGTLIEGNGVKPDIEVQTSRRDFRRKDPVLTAALELLRE